MTRALHLSSARSARARIAPTRAIARVWPRRAFTLIEMVLSLSLLSLVMAAATAVVALAARTAPDSGDPLAKQMTLQSVVDQMALDAADASEIELQGTHTVRMICDDLTGDGDPDTIVYSWSGVRGEPLVRALNGDRRVLVEKVDVVAFSAEGVLRSAEGEVASVTRTEQVVAATPRIGATGTEYNVRTNGAAQRFVPRLASSATSWSLRRVSLWLDRDGLPDSQGAVQIWSDSNGRPGAVLAQATFSELSLSTSPSKESFPISLNNMDPGTAYWIVVRATFLSSPCGLLESPNRIASDHECKARYNSSNATWTIDDDGSIYFEVVGDVTLAEPLRVIESRGTALFARLEAQDQTAVSGVHLSQRPTLTGDEDAVIDVGASQVLLDAVVETVDGIVDATGGLLDGLLGGK